MATIPANINTTPTTNTTTTGKYDLAIAAIKGRITLLTTDLTNYEAESLKYRDYVDKYTEKCSEIMLIIAQQQLKIDHLREAQEHLQQRQAEDAANDQDSTPSEGDLAAVLPAESVAETFDRLSRDDDKDFDF